LEDGFALVLPVEPLDAGTFVPVFVSVFGAVPFPAVVAAGALSVDDCFVGAHGDSKARLLPADNENVTAKTTTPIL